MHDFKFEYNDTAKVATPVDARVRGGIAVVCEFIGTQYSPDKTRRCKYFIQSKYRDCCQWCYEKTEVKICGKAGD